MNAKKQILSWMLIASLFGVVFSAHAQKTYTSPDNSYTLTYTLVGTNATITGGTFQPEFSGALEIPATIQDGSSTYTVVSVGIRALDSISNLTSVTLPNTLKTIENNAFYMSGISSNVIFHEGLEKIGDNAFSGTKIAGTINFPLSLKTLGSACFSNTPNLEYVHFHENSSITKIPPYAFYKSSIRNMSLPKGLTEIANNAYAFCNNMDVFTLEFPVSLKTIGDAAFAYWRKEPTTKAVFPGRNKLVFPEGSQLTSIGKDAFRNGNWYGDIKIPEGVTKIEPRTFLRNEQWIGQITLHEHLTEIGDNALELLGSTQVLLIPSAVLRIGKEAFYGSPFSGIAFAPDSKVTYIGPGAFKNCFNLNYLDLTSITSLHAENASREASTSNTSQYAYMPKYTMVYLPNGSTVKDGEENFVVGGECQNFVVYDSSPNYFCINDRIFDNDRVWVGEKNRVVEDRPTPENFGVSRGCDYGILHQFTAKKATYKNRIFEAVQDKIYTICLPYAATVPAGMQAYELKKKGEKTYIFTSIAGSSMEANRPYLLRVVNPSASLSFASDIDAFVSTTEGAILAQNAGDGLIFRGTTTNILNAEARNKNYYNLSNRVWYRIYIKEGAPKWVGVTDQDATNGYKGYIHSMRAYVEDPSASSLSFVVLMEDETEANPTAIEQIENEVKNQNVAIYSVEGYYLGKNIDELPSGAIYIVNGQKIYKY